MFVFLNKYFLSFFIFFFAIFSLSFLYNSVFIMILFVGQEFIYLYESLFDFPVDYHLFSFYSFIPSCIRLSFCFFYLYLNLFYFILSFHLRRFFLLSFSLFLSFLIRFLCSIIFLSNFHFILFTYHLNSPLSRLHRIFQFFLLFIFWHLLVIESLLFFSY